MNIEEELCVMTYCEDSGPLEGWERIVCIGTRKTMKVRFPEGIPDGHKMYIGKEAMGLLGSVEKALVEKKKNKK